MGKQPTKPKVVSVKIVKQASSPAGTEDGHDSEESKGFLQISYAMKDVRSLFLRSICLVYLIAFVSIYVQTEGLFGTNGVTPVKSELRLTSRSPSLCMKEKHSLLCWMPDFFKVDSQRCMEIMAILGALFASVGTMCVHCCVVPTMAFLWVCYYSLYQVGNVFLWFQWDILLLETGFLAILVAPWLPTRSQVNASKPRDLITFWMLRWLLFRLMFSSGIVKLQSGCPTWWGLSALDIHFESQCLPTPLAFYVHHFPQWLLHLMTVGTYYVEILVPFAFFAPFVLLRRIAFVLQIMFQVSIILTGNYTFFNLLTIVLCLSLVDDRFFTSKSKESDESASVATRLTTRSFSFILIGLSLYYTIKYFDLNVNWKDWSIQSKIAFTRKDFDWFVSLAVPYSILLGFLTLASTIAQTIIISLLDVKGGWKKLTSFFSCVFYGFVCVALFGVTLVPYTSLHKETNAALWPSLRQVHSDLSKYHLTSSYGLFRRMTGVNGRPEIQLEYSDSSDGPWKEYQFLYKPGDVSAAPGFVAPHQPRLDWQMWFAALGTYHDNPWLVSLAYRLLQGQTSVIRLIDMDSAPQKPPKYLRASLFTYSFSGTSTPASTWWTRKRSNEYMPVFSRDHSPLVDFVTNLGYLDADVKNENTTLAALLDKIRGLVQAVSKRPEVCVWAILFTFLMILLIGSAGSSTKYYKSKVN